MKKVLFILLISTLAHAQNSFRWADSAAVWHYTYNFSGVGYSKYSYVVDTLVENKMCQKIIEQSQQRIQTGPGIFAVQPIYAGTTLYVYKSNDSVFTYRNGNFYLAFKTNAILGEVWDLGVFYPSINSKHAFVKVDSIFYNSYNGVNLRNIKIYSCDSLGNQIFSQPQGTPSSSWLPYVALFNNNIINEKFGPNVKLSGINNALLDEWMNEVIPSELLCFQSNSFSLYQAGISDCNNGILTEINEIETTENIYLYPNPANDRIYFSNSTLFKTLNIYNNIGQSQQTFINSNNSGIDISLLSKGFYTYTITDNKQNIIANGKFIKE